MPPIAGQASPDPTAMDALAYGSRSPSDSGAAQSPDAVREKTERAVSMIRDYSAQLSELQKLIPGSDRLIAQMQKQLRQLAVMAAQAGPVQNQSADQLPV
jgi:hypothetical protein